MVANHPTPAAYTPASASPSETAKTGHTRSISAKMEVAALLLAGGRGTKETATQCGVSERTLRRWWNEDREFIWRVKEHRTSLLAETIGQLATLGGKAATTLHRLLDDESPGIRLRASAIILNALLPGYRALEERTALNLGEKALRFASELDAERARLRDEQRRLDDERQRLNDEWMKLRSSGVGGPYGQGR
jgi:hypothetical protein